MSYAQWNPATTYVQNDIVSYLGSLFVSLQTPNLNQNPSTATTYWAVSGGVGGVTKITAGTGVSITPTGGIGNVTINATGGGGGPTWQEISVAPLASYTQGQNIVNFGISPIPSNDPIPVVVLITFTSMTTVSPALGDSYVALGNLQIIPTTVEWNTNDFANPPPGSQYTFTYQFMIPPGLQGNPIGITALWNYPACTCSSRVYICA